MVKILNRKFKLYQVYYLLAGFDILLITISLLINHSHVKSFENSIDINRKYVQASNLAENLTELAAMTNAPGNDIFDSHDVALERARLNIAVEKFDSFFLIVRGQVGQVGQAKLLGVLDQIDNSMKEMLAVANSIFENFEKNDRSAAGSKMATMDQKFAILNQQLGKFRVLLDDMQAMDLKAQSNDIRSASMLENVLGIVVVVMVLLITWFGHAMGRRTERQEGVLREQAKMVALGEMAGGVAHEINNPLAIIRTKASQLKRLIVAGKFERLQATTFLQEIEDTSIRISKIVDGLRTFSRATGNEPKIEIQLNKILTDVQGLCQERLRNHGVKFDLETLEGVELFCRPVQLEQILVNLINNAFDAIQGTSNPWIHVETIRGKESIDIVVTDSGPGIPDKIADKLMQPFYTTKPVGKGTGLGLSISLGIAESHGGNLKLNRNAKNTQFILTLPLTGSDANLLRVAS